MLSELERIIYTEILKIPIGQVTSYYSVYDRLLNLLFIPSVVALIFFYSATEPLKNHKGIRFLVIVSGMAFAIDLGLYGFFVTLSQIWYLILILVSGFLFIFGMFISPDTKIKLPNPSDRVYRSIKAIDTKLEGLYGEKSSIENRINVATASLASATNPATISSLRTRISDLTRKMSDIDNQIRDLVNQRARLVKRMRT